MKEASIPDLRIVERRLKWSPYIACLGGAAAMILGVWVPLYPIVLGLAAAAGTASFAILWYNLRRRRKSMILDPSLPVLLTFAVGLLRPPDEAGYAVMALSGARFSAVWVLTFVGLLAILRNRLRGDLGLYAS